MSCVECDMGLWQCSYLYHDGKMSTPCECVYDQSLERCPRCGSIKRQWVPDIEEIYAAAAAIRQSWSESERYRRCHGGMSKAHVEIEEIHRGWFRVSRSHKME